MNKLKKDAVEVGGAGGERVVDRATTRVHLLRRRRNRPVSG